MISNIREVFSILILRSLLNKMSVYLSSLLKFSQKPYTPEMLILELAAPELGPNFLRFTKNAETALGLQYMGVALQDKFFCATGGGAGGAQPPANFF